MKNFKKLLLMAIVAVFGIIFFASCEKDAFFNQGAPKPPVDPSSLVKLYCNTGTKAELREVTSNSIIYTDSLYKTLFHMDPNEGSSIAKGDYSISLSGNQIFLAPNVNGIGYKFPHGTYRLDVVNITLNGVVQTSITNVTIISGPQNPPINVENTFPIRLYDLIEESNQITVRVRANISQWGNISSNSFDYVKRIDQNGWMTGPATRSGDSLFFKLSFPKVNGSYIEFNARYMPENNWLTPSYGNPPSVLYAGPSTPYSDSHSYFGFKLVKNGNVWELRTYNNLLLLSSTPTQETIPGNYGDGIENNYQVRWSGNKIYFRTTNSNIVRYKIDNGSWSYITATNCQENGNYKYCVQNLPNGSTTNIIITQWGIGSNDNNFVPATAEIINSSFAHPTPSGQGTSIVVYQ